MSSYLNSRLTVFMLLCLLGLSLLVLSVRSQNIDVYSNFTSENSKETFYHMSLRNNGDVYISSQKNIYRLSYTFNVERQNETCSGEHCSNINKILLVDEESSRLITCGGENGRCESRLLDDLTYVTKDSAVKIVADKNLSSIGFMATKNAKKYLYVAATDDGSIASFNTISIRSLNSFSAFDTFRVNNKFIGADKIKYVTGFSYQKYRYFVANINEQLTGQQTSNQESFPRISRICDGDNLDHLSDVYLKCTGVSDYQVIKAVSLSPAGPNLAHSLGISPGDNVLYAVFTMNSTSVKSALCIYKWSELERAFVDAIVGCATDELNKDKYKLNYATNNDCPGQLTLSRKEVIGFSCQNTGSWSYSQGTTNQAALSNAMLELPNQNFTAITTTIERNHTVAFVGTADGHLLKVHLVDSITARLYDEMILDEGNIVRSDMVVNDTTLLTLTEKHLFRVRVENCARYTSCNQCIGSNAGKDGDPYCGWCTLDKKCTKYDGCTSGAWLPYNEEQCIAITEVYPANLPHSQPARILAIEVQNLPPLADGNSYQCIFNGTGIVQPATLKNESLSCQSPPPETLPLIPTATDHISVTIFIRSTLTGVDFVETSYDFYSCNAHDRCSECVGSKWNCNWCVMSNKCSIHPQQDCQDASIVIKGEKKNAADRCPQIVPGQSQKLHVGVADEFRIKTNNVPPIISKVFCQIDILKTRLGARRVGDDVICESKSFNYPEELQNITAKVMVLWETIDVHSTIDNEYSVTLYNCSVQRPDCSRCLSNITADPSLGCVWCSSKGCTVDSLCTKANNECPAPVIAKITPRFVATVEDINTVSTVDVVTIEGTDIGQQVTDIVSVKIGGINSEIISDKYNVGKSVTVFAPAFNESGDKQVVMMVKGSDGQNKPSESFNLKYQNPQVSDFTPKIGPKSGGVNVTITGTLFGTGSQLEVWIGQSVCNIMSIKDTLIVCKTNESNSLGFKDVTVKFYNANRTSDAKFKYEQDPNITSVYPMKVFESGGRVLTVKGYYFNTIQNPKVLVEWNGKIFEEDCQGNFTSTEMYCPSPNLSQLSRRKRRQSDSENNAYSDVVLGFQFANVKDLLTWSENNPDFDLEIYPDPIYYTFNNTNKYKSDVIDGGVFDLNDYKVLIRGDRLNLASEKKDVLVFVGDKKCEVSILSNDLLQCFAPKSAPNTDRSGSPTKDYPLVTVVHGNIVVEIGPVKYPEHSWWLYAVLAAAGTVMLFILLLVILFFYCKTKRIERDKERVLEEMELLEESVREDSRRAIAELTTNLDDLTTELGDTGMPFLTMLDYMKNMMFTGYEKVPADHGSDKKEQYPNEHGLREFAKLLGKKDFLVAFIEMVEKNPKIGKKQKGNFASLLTVGMIAERKLPYFTEVLTVLLEEYIQEGVEFRRSKQLFRRTETVREKLLSNWTALCMYDHLKDHAGYPLYLLYQAIKCKVWKGPVDAVTHKSYHSLSIDDLLKDNVVFDEIELKVSMDKGDTQMISVSVLTCDSITQVKEKILDAMYKSRPYSSRPSASSVDLDLRAGNHGHLVLSDIDNSSRINGHWRQLNTLECFKIKNGSLVALVPKQEVANAKPSSVFISPTSIEHLENTIHMDAKIGFSSEDYNLENGIQTWHLVKDVDPLEDEHRNSSKKNKSGSIYRRKLKTIHEVHFPRLMSTKTTIQKYVDRMFEAILKAPSEDSNHSVPVTIKYLFDFFDKQAELNEVGQDMSKTWKNNSLGQRFWVTVITHPNFIFDILQTLPVEAALRIIAETLIDSCSVEAITYTKDTSTNRLLYTREVPKYREYVDKFYSSIQQMPTAAKNFLNEELECVNENFLDQFSHLSTLQHLYSYAERDRVSLMDGLDQGMNLELIEQFEQVELAFQSNQNHC